MMCAFLTAVAWAVWWWLADRQTPLHVVCSGEGDAQVRTLKPSG
jgi:hypothetical protein